MTDYKFFNGIPTFLVYLIPKPSFFKNSSGTIWLIARRIRKVHTLRKGICPIMNVIAWLEFELAYHESADQRFNHYSA